MTIPSCNIGLAMTGSFCTYDRVFNAMEKLVSAGAQITPILSFNGGNIDTRFGTGQSFKERLFSICGRPIIDTIELAEPIGPQKMFDVLVVAPCTGNTLSKLTAGITDTPVTMAVKSHLRNNNPVVIALATNDALSGNAVNLGTLLNRKNYYFVPMRQDAAYKKPRSVVADFSYLSDAISSALEGKQMQPILLPPILE